MNDKESSAHLAFEYALGTLRGAERERFAKSLRENNALAEEVRYWESALAPSTDTLPQLEPKPETFTKIKDTINKRSAATPIGSETRFWDRLLPWKMATFSAFSLLIASMLFLAKPLLSPSENVLNADYVAVLVNEQDEPILTALTASDGSKLWLKWEGWEPPQGHSLQLWAQSRRDKEIRPLLIFENEEIREFALDQATWRLIKDSSYLIITQEEPGGSAIDEPSEMIVARGVCIRLAAASS